MEIRMKKAKPKRAWGIKRNGKLLPDAFSDRQVARYCYQGREVTIVRIELHEIDKRGKK